MGRSTVIWCFVLFLGMVVFASDAVSAFSFPRDRDVDCAALYGGCGECMNIDRCAALLDLLKSRQIPDQDKGDYLRSLHCGWSNLRIPRVCCECSQ